MVGLSRILSSIACGRTDLHSPCLATYPTVLTSWVQPLQTHYRSGLGWFSPERVSSPLAFGRAIAERWLSRW